MASAVVPKLFPGSTIVCMATGPSLTQEDADHVRGRCPVIAVNFAVSMAPWAAALYSSDRQWWPRASADEKHGEAVRNFQGLRFGIGSTVGKTNPFSGMPDVQVLKNTGFTGLETDPSGLRNGRSSGFAALNLAVHFGAKRILLLGYNMNVIRGRAHCYEERAGYPAHTALYPNWIRSFDTIVEPLRQLGVEVLNCTEDSSLRAFQSVPLREAV